MPDLTYFLPQPGDVKILEGDISNLRGACDDMSKKVTNLTAGKGKIFQSPKFFKIFWGIFAHEIFLL